MYDTAVSRCGAGKVLRVGASLGNAGTNAICRGGTWRAFLVVMKKTQSLHQLLSVLVAAAAPLSAACGHTGETLLPESATCPSFSNGTEYAAFAPAPGMDGVAIANLNDRTAAVTPIGAPCKTAKDSAACNAKVKQRLADAATTTGWSVGGGQLGSTTEHYLSWCGDPG